MTALIVVESMFGNTKRVADLIATALSKRIHVEVVDVDEAPMALPDEVTLLAVGGPTHAFGMSRDSTREAAADKGATGGSAAGIRDWLESVSGIAPRLPAIAFDTRVHKKFVPGSAGRAASRRLERLGCTVIEAPISFYVADIAGPLVAGEEQRVIDFAEMLLRDLERRGLLPEAA
jgi:hypothetical protein